MIYTRVKLIRVFFFVERGVEVACSRLKVKEWKGGRVKHALDLEPITLNS
jgi:hypothetical protein